MWCTGEISEAGILVEGATSKVNQSGLECSWHDQYVFEFDVTVEYVALGTMLQTVDDLFQNFPVSHGNFKFTKTKDLLCFAFIESLSF